MATHTYRPNNTLSALALASLSGLAFAQEQLPSVTVSGSAQAPVRLAGFGDTAQVRLPLQTLSIDAERLRSLGLNGLAALPQLDASVSDGYNASGYYAQLRVRGFELDNRFNLRRDGLPINGETALLLFNKSGAELLKGSSGLQAGTSSPAGLLNLRVKRPQGELLSVALDLESSASRSLQLDWSTRLNGEWGLRINALAAELDPWLRKSHGRQRGLAMALDWRASPTLLLELEAEHSHQQQPSQPGFSLLGERLPEPADIDRRRNLNDTPWRLPVVFNGNTASLRATQKLSTDWRLSLQAQRQGLRSDDRVAFPFGCSAENRFDRYCSDGSYDLYDFRSDNERRTSTALRAALEGQIGRHSLRLEALHTRYSTRLQQQAFNYAGTGSVFGGGSSSADPSLTDENTNRSERSQELALSDQWQLGSLELFGGLRHTRLQRAAVRTDGSRPTDYRQGFNTPWAGLSWALAPELRLYASAGQGIESEVTPNRSFYQDPGRALPALKSRSLEAGLKAGSRSVDWSAGLFRIQRPVWSDIGPCDDSPASCQRRADGEVLHQGLELQADLKWHSGGLLASGLWLQAERRQATDASLNGRTPVNTPTRSLRLALRQQVAAGLQLSAQLSHEGPRAVLSDHSLKAKAWTTLGLNARYDQPLRGHLLRWVLGVDNAANRQAWKETPLQFGHHYLFPLPPRRWHLGVEATL